LLLEWPERIQGVLPENNMWISIEYVAEEHRQMLFKATGERFDALLADLRQSLVGGD